LENPVNVRNRGGKRLPPLEILSPMKLESKPPTAVTKAEEALRVVLATGKREDEVRDDGRKGGTI
jgi:hypothetical protein